MSPYAHVFEHLASTLVMLFWKVVDRRPGFQR